MACHKPCIFMLGRKEGWKFILGQELFTVQNQSWLNLAHSKLNNSKKRNGSKSKNENAGETTQCNSLSTVSQMQVRQGDQPWYPEDTIELRWTQLYGLPVSPCRLKALWNRVWLTHNGTLAGTTRKANPINRPEINSSNKTYRLKSKPHQQTRKVRKFKPREGVLGLAPAIRKGGFLA